MNAPITPPLGTARRWKPSPLISGALTLHADAAVAVTADPSTWPWAGGGVIASHLVLMAGRLWPHGTWLGPNWTHLPAMAGQRTTMTIDDGPDPDVTPRVLDIPDQYGAKATFFYVGELAQRHPRCVEIIVVRGYAVENHSQRHQHVFSLKEPGALRCEVAAAQDTLMQIAGTRPLFFCAPAGLHDPSLELVLCRLDLQLASWTRRGFNTRSRSPETVTQRLLHSLAPQDILLLYGGHAVRDAHGDPVLLTVLPKVLETAARAQLQCATLRAALAPEPAQATRSQMTI